MKLTLIELEQLITKAKQMGRPPKKRKLGNRGNRQGDLLQHLSRCQRRNVFKQKTRFLTRKRKQKPQKRRACRQADTMTTTKKGYIRIGTWNTRGFGAQYGKDPEGKLRCIAAVVAERRWNVALLTDLRFPENGCREFKVGSSTWLLIHEGRVGVALDPFFAHRWRGSGSTMYKAKGEDIHNRMIGVSIPGTGWKPGLLLIPIYAPLTGRTQLSHKDNFRDQLSRLLDSAFTRLKPILGGDFNGEVGAAKDRLWKHVLGPYGDHRRTKGGEELLQFCEQEGLVVANSFTQQTCKATWFHNRWGTAHALDHFLIQHGDRKWVRRTLTLNFSHHPAPASTPKIGRPDYFTAASWLAYTDHNPVELELSLGKDWKAEADKRNQASQRPDVFRMMGSSPEAKSLRQQYTDSVTDALTNLEGVHLDWDAAAAVMKSCALATLGPTPPRSPFPWLKGKEVDLKRLQDAVHTTENTLAHARKNHRPDVNALLDKRRQTSKTLLAHKRRWEAEWWDDWDDLADTAQKAGDQRDELTFWSVCKTLGFRDTRTVFHRCSSRTVANPELDREAWKDFPNGIQTGKGEIDPSVWEHIPSSTTVADELAESIS